MESEIEFEVVYARPEQQTVIALKAPAGTTAGEALALTGLTRRFPELEASAVRLGIYGRLVDASTTLAAGDRLEIYRDLTADPKQARRGRARRG